MEIALRLCDCFLLWFELGKKIDNQEDYLDGDYVGSQLGVVMGVIIGVSVGKPDGDKIGCWNRIILVTVLNTELGNRGGFSLYWALVPILVYKLGGWYMPNGDGTEMISHYWCLCFSVYFSAVSRLVTRQECVCCAFPFFFCVDRRGQITTIRPSIIFFTYGKFLQKVHKLLFQ